MPNSLICGDSISGAYNDKTIAFYVHIPFDGNLIFDATLSTFAVTAIEGFTESDPTAIAQDTDKDEIVTLNNIVAGNYRFLLAANPLISGTFVVQIQCESDSPTSTPTKNTANRPTNTPILFTLNSTYFPTETPTNKSFINAPTNNFNLTTTKYIRSTVGLKGKKIEKPQNENMLVIVVLIGVIMIFCCLIFLLFGIYKFCRRRRQKSKKIELSQNEMRRIEPGVITLESWLSELDLMDYYNIFLQNGFGDAESVDFRALQSLKEQNLKDLGIKKMAHRILILQQIKKDKQGDGNNNNMVVIKANLNHDQNSLNEGNLNRNALNIVECPESDTSENDSIYDGEIATNDDMNKYHGTTTGNGREINQNMVMIPSFGHKDSDEMYLNEEHYKTTQELTKQTLVPSNDNKNRLITMKPALNMLNRQNVANYQQNTTLGDGQSTNNPLFKRQQNVDWNCSGCTFLNKSSSLYCAICGTPNTVNINMNDGNIKEEIGKCVECKVEAAGKKADDGTFYCNDCWAIFLNENYETII